MINYDFITKIWNLKRTTIVDEEKSYIELKGINQILHLYLKKSNVFCSYCNSEKAIIRSSKIQSIKHTMLGGNPCSIIFHKRVYKCLDCNKMFNESFDLIFNHRGVSLATDIEILYSLKNIRTTYKDAALKYNVSSTYVRNIFDRYIDIDRHTLPTVLSIDEVYAKKLTSTKYACVLFDPINDKLIDVLYSRHKNDLERYFNMISNKELLNVKYVVIDLYTTYKDISYLTFNNPIVAVDSFHVIENLNRKFRQVRISVMRDLEKYKHQGNFDYWLLKKFYWILEADFDNVRREFEFTKKKMVLDKYRILHYMLELDPTIKEAYLLKDAYLEFNKYSKFDEAKELLDELIDDFHRSNIKEMNEFGRLLYRWRKEIINSFIRINGKRLSNGKIERTNRQIKTLFNNAYGFRNFYRTRNRCMFVINKNEQILGEPKKENNNMKGNERGNYKK